MTQEPRVPESRHARPLLRLVPIALLLAAYPGAAVLLRNVHAPAPERGPVELLATAVAGASESAPLEIEIAVRNVADTPHRVDQVSATLFVDDRPAVTVVQDAAAVEPRLGPSRLVAPGATVALARIPLPFAVKADNASVIVSALVARADASRGRSVHTELDIGSGAAPSATVAPPFEKRASRM